MKKLILIAAVALAGCATNPNQRPVYVPINIPPVTFTPMQVNRAPSPSAVLPSQSPTAVWTGRQEMTQTITGQQGWLCGYNYNGQTFTRVFVGSCPASIAVQ